MAIMPSFLADAQLRNINTKARLREYEPGFLLATGLPSVDHAAKVSLIADASQSSGRPSGAVMC